MSFTYEPGNLADDDVTRVRFLTHDTVSPGVLADEEIEWLVSQENNIYLAAASAAETMAAKFSADKGKTVGDLSLFSGNDQAAGCRALAKSLRMQAVRHLTVTPISTGQSIDDKQTNEDDLDLTPHYFRVGQHDNPGTTSDTAVDLDSIERG